MPHYIGILRWTKKGATHKEVVDNADNAKAKGWTMSEHEIRTKWHIAAPIIMDELKIKRMSLTEFRRDPHSLNVIQFAHKTIEAQIRQDRIEGPVTANNDDVKKKMALLEPEFDDRWENKWLKYPIVRRVLKKILRWDVHSELLKAINEDRLYIHHYHVTVKE